MLTVIDIIRALSEMIEENFPNYPVHDKDLTENYDRPCYYIDVETVRTTYDTATFFRESADIEIYFFAEEIHAGFLELLKMKSQLQRLLSFPLKIADNCHAVFSNIDMTVSNADKCLAISLSTEIIQDIAIEEEYPLIESLEINI